MRLRLPGPVAGEKDGSGGARRPGSGEERGGRAPRERRLGPGGEEAGPRGRDEACGEAERREKKGEDQLERERRKAQVGRPQESPGPRGEARAAVSPGPARTPVAGAPGSGCEGWRTALAVTAREGPRKGFSWFTCVERPAFLQPVGPVGSARTLSVSAGK